MGSGLAALPLPGARRPAPGRRGSRLLGAALLLLLGVVLSALPASAQAGWGTQTTTLPSVIIGTTSCATATDCVQQNNAGRFQYTSNGGASWTLSAANLTDSTWGMDCPSANICFATGDNGDIHKSTDHGATWNTSFTGNPALYGIECPTDLLCYATTVDGRFRKTVDGGTTWTIGATQSTVGIYSVSCPSTVVCYAVTATGEVRRKQAATDTWDLVATGASMPDVLSPYTHGITCPSLTVCYVAATDGTINKTSDGGTSWTPQTSAASPDLYAIDCWSVTRCLAVGVANRSMFTDDGGTTWTQETTGSAAAMYSVEFATGTKALTGNATGAVYEYTAPALPAGGTNASATILGGSLSFINSTPSNVVFPNATLDGTDQTRTQSQALAVADTTGSANGWAITATSTRFTSPSGALRDDATTLQTLPSAACHAGSTCELPVNAVPYPFSLPAGATAPPASKLFNAAGSTGMGALTVTPNWTLALPADTRAGTYTATWTFTLVSGP